jgi:hypothetical protein
MGGETSKATGRPPGAQAINMFPSSSHPRYGGPVDGAQSTTTAIGASFLKSPTRVAPAGAASQVFVFRGKLSGSPRAAAGSVPSVQDQATVICQPSRGWDLLYLLRSLKLAAERESNGRIG